MLQHVQCLLFPVTGRHTSFLFLIYDLFFVGGSAGPTIVYTTYDIELRQWDADLRHTLIDTSIYSFYHPSGASLVVSHSDSTAPRASPTSRARASPRGGRERFSQNRERPRRERCEGANGRAPIYPWAFWTSAVKIQSAYRRVSAMQVASTLRRWQMEDSYVWSDSSDEEEGW
jgi:hypothetical protein